MRVAASLIVAAALCGSVEADEAQRYIPEIETHYVRSKHVSQTFKVQVMQPLRARGEKTRFPVIYATDGNATFDALEGISYSIQTTGHDAPRYVLVGIGYPGDSPRAGAVLRGRDLTFPGYPELGVTPPPVEGVLLPRQGTKAFQGAPEFQRFIKEELIPFIDERYPTVTGERTYFGHSAAVVSGSSRCSRNPIFSGTTSSAVRVSPIAGAPRLGFSTRTTISFSTMRAGSSRRASR